VGLHVTKLSQAPAGGRNKPIVLQKCIVSIAAGVTLFVGS
jgi:hypothetical protein